MKRSTPELQRKGQKMDAVRSFQDLKVWQKAHCLTLDIYRITKTFPQDEKYCLTNQLRRSSLSICANISEGYKKSRKDFIRFLDISIGSLEETKCFLIIANDLKYCSCEQFDKLMRDSDEIGKMLNGLKRSLVVYSRT